MIKKVSSFTKQMFIRQYIPALSSALVLSIADMADALVVGNKMGATGLAAIAFSIPIFMVFNVVMHSFGLGGAVDFAQKMSKGEEKEATEDFQGVMVFVLGLGLVMAVLGNLFTGPIATVLGAPSDNAPLVAATVTYLRYLFAAAPFFFFAYTVGYYMRNDDLQKESSIASQVGNVCDFFLNIILVLLCGMGVSGAAISTMSGVIITSLLQIFFIRSTCSHLRLDHLRPNFKELFRSYKTGFSSCISYIYTFLFIWIGNNALSRLSGEIGVAVFEVVQSLSYMIWYIFNAISTAVQPILTAYESECNYDESDGTGILTRNVGIITALLLAVLITVLAEPICLLFGLNTDASIVYGVYALRIFALSVLFTGFNILLANIHASKGNTIPAFLISTFRGALILIPVMLILLNFGEKAFWFTYPVTEFLSFLIMTIYSVFFMKKKNRIDPKMIYSATLHGDIKDLGEVLSKVEVFLESWDASPKQMYYVQMTIEEVCSAIINIGFKNTPSESSLIQLTLVSRGNKEFSMNIRDNALSFNPFGLDRKKAHEVDEDSSDDFNALGMEVIKKKAKSFYYRRYQGFNTMVVKI